MEQIGRLAGWQAGPRPLLGQKAAADTWARIKQPASRGREAATGLGKHPPASPAALPCPDSQRMGQGQGQPAPARGEEEEAGGQVQGCGAAAVWHSGRGGREQALLASKLATKSQSVLLCTPATTRAPAAGRTCPARSPCSPPPPSHPALLACLPFVHLRVKELHCSSHSGSSSQLICRSGRPWA